MVYSINIVKIRYLTYFQLVKIIQNSGNHIFKFFTVLFHGTFRDHFDTLSHRIAAQFFQDSLVSPFTNSIYKNQPGSSWLRAILGKCGYPTRWFVDHMVQCSVHAVLGSYRDRISYNLPLSIDVYYKNYYCADQNHYFMKKIVT